MQFNDYFWYMILRKCIFGFLLVIHSGWACSQPSSFSNQVYHPDGNTIAERFIPPFGFHRLPVESSTFAHYLRNFHLKNSSAQVLLYNGQPKYNQQVHAAVLDISTGKKDLQQCADAVMRLRAEYLFAQNRFDDIHFNFTNGFTAYYSKWRKGYSIRVNGNQCQWIQSDKANASYESFMSYLEKVFMYAGTASLEKELTSVSMTDIQPGDVFIKGGSPGHAVIVMDVCLHPQTGERLFLLAQSYMPAQDIHILINPQDGKISPWYSNQIVSSLITPEWTFEKKHLRRF